MSAPKSNHPPLIIGEMKVQPWLKREYSEIDSIPSLSSSIGDLREAFAGRITLTPRNTNRELGRLPRITIDAGFVGKASVTLMMRTLGVNLEPHRGERVGVMFTPEFSRMWETEMLPDHQATLASGVAKIVILATGEEAHDLFEMSGQELHR